jgi:hypothetical protein
MTSGWRAGELTIIMGESTKGKTMIGSTVTSLDVPADVSQNKTERGFRYNEFVDSYGHKCSLQKSSSAMEDKIWLGVNDPEPMIKVHDALKLGRADLCDGQTVGWVPFPLPEEVLCHTRMHLTQAQVKALLPALQHFAETGELPEIEELTETVIPE